jgi:hypothetical protein
MGPSLKPSRPKDRFELAQRFFPELSDPGKKADAVASIELNTRACEVVLLDLIKRHDELFDELGAGVLVINLNNPDESQVGYVTLEGWEQDLQLAKDLQDTSCEGFFEKVVRLVKANEDRSGVLLLLIDSKSQRLLTLPRDLPAEEIRDIQAQLAAGSKGAIILGGAKRLKPMGFGKPADS